MKWALKAKPTDASLNDWYWEALREDQNQFRNGFNEPTAAAAMAAARAAATEYEQYVANIESHTVEEEFTPVI